VRCLILSHAFNMDGRAASHTVTDKLEHLRANGWDLYVLSAVTGELDKVLWHRQLLPWGAAGFRFDIRHWLAAKVGRGGKYRLLLGFISVPLLPFILLEKVLIGASSQWSWSLPAAVFGAYYARRFDIQVIYSSGGAWSAHLAAWFVSKATPAKWIAEFHDPMVERYGGSDLVSSPASSREKSYKRSIEALVCREAHLVWWFTESARDFALKRHPAAAIKSFCVMPGAPSVAKRMPYVPTEKIRIGHFGSLSDSRSLTDFLLAFSRVKSRYTSNPFNVELHVYGAELDKKARDVVKLERLEGNVVTHGRLEKGPSVETGRDMVVALMQQQDYLLLIHGNDESCKEYIPSKIYEYWSSQRPVIALVHNNEELNRLTIDINGTDRLTAPSSGTGVDNAILFAIENLRDYREFASLKPPRTCQDAVTEICAQVQSKIICQVAP